MNEKKNLCIEKYVQMKHGVINRAYDKVDYHLTEPIWLAFTGQTAVLEEYLQEGMPVYGFNKEIFDKLETISYLDVRPREEFFNGFTVYGESFCNTLEAAIAGGHLDTLCLLLRYGAKLDLRCQGQLEALYLCEDRETIEYILNTGNKGYGYIDFDKAWRKYGWNYTLIETLYRLGCQPPKDIIDRLLRSESIVFKMHSGLWKKSLNALFEEFLGMLNETETGRFLAREGYKPEWTGGKS